MNANDKKTLLAIEGKRFMVTGGGGYVGNRIVLGLLRQNAASVTVVDLRFQGPESIPDDLKAVYTKRVRQATVDLRDEEKIHGLLADIDLVIHTASFGMSGKDMLMKEKVRSINVGGTRALLHACVKQGVVGFIYTSSANVVFSGRKELADIAEDLPYNTEEECVDEYSRTKRAAEMLTLEYNGKQLDQENPILFEEMAQLDGKSANRSIPNEDPANPNSEFVGRFQVLKSSSDDAKIGQNGNPAHPLEPTKLAPCKTLKTCAIRPAGIYGEGEERHFPRIIGMLDAGLLVFKVGAPGTLVDWVHVDNLVFAHILAAAKLVTGQDESRPAAEAPRSIVGGKAYYISDQRPINQWEFLRPLIEGLGFTYPKVFIPFKVMFHLAFLVEVVHGLVNPYYPFEPFVNRAEVCKVGVTHFFRTSKAERELGWHRLVTPEQGMDRMVTYFQQKQEEKKEALKKAKKKLKHGNDPWIAIIIVALIGVMLWQVYSRM